MIVKKGKASLLLPSGIDQVVSVVVQRGSQDIFRRMTQVEPNYLDMKRMDDIAGIPMFFALDGRKLSFWPRTDAKCNFIIDVTIRKRL